ncbi:hypothetical protein V6N13_112075 [Hibiscus sabdariffa]
MVGQVVHPLKAMSDPLLVRPSALTGAITTPLDVIKTRLMVQGGRPPALLKGPQPRVLRIGISGSIFFGVLESTKRLLAERRPKPSQEPKHD